MPTRCGSCGRHSADANYAGRSCGCELCREKLRALSVLEDALTSAKRDGGVEALREAAELCATEARSCAHHAKAFAESHPKDKVTLAQAHEMCAQQSDACAHYIRHRADELAKGG